MSERASLPAHTEVAVIGFGPSGAVAAAMLGHLGIRTVAVDRQTAVYDKPRAIAIDHEILRQFDNLGVAPQVLPYVAPFPASQHFGADGQLIRRVDMVGEPYPLGYTPSMVFSQPPVEEALRDHARAMQGVTVSLGTEFVALDQDETRVTLHLRESDGALRIVTADYVIACDGASSSVRQTLGLELDDLVFDEPWLVVDLLVHDHVSAKLPETAAQFCDPSRPTSFIIGPKNHRRFEIMLLPGEDPREMEQPDEVWALLARWLTPQDATLWRAASYRFHALVAHRWSKGRVFLAGDAAHQQPPFIGQGMCQGLRDVGNLIWKLERVLRGRSPPSLLETYGEERGEHVRQLTGRIKSIGHVICERDPQAARERDAKILAEGGGTPRTITRQEIVPPLSVGLLSRHKSSARGTLFPQPTVITPDGAVLLDAACGTGCRLILDGRNPLDVPRNIDPTWRVIAIGPSTAPNATCARERDGVVAAWFDTHTCRAALVRPDHYVFGTAGNDSELETLVQEFARRLI